MVFSLDKVVPWGRSYIEYVAMFSLSKDDLTKKLLGCSDGPASFNCNITKTGGKIVSVDPLYKFTKSHIKQRIEETFSVVIAQTKQNLHEFKWENIRSVEELAEIPNRAMNEFLMDYEPGSKQGRYVAAGLPSLPFRDKAFDLAPCSHFLFLYSELFSFDFHLQVIEELCRIAKEVRMFPLLELGSRKSRHLDGTMDYFNSHGFDITIQQVNYEFQKGGNKMLVLKSK